MRSREEYLTKNPVQTEGLGKKIAREILKLPQKKRAVVIGLVGDLGGGKTTFVRGLAKALGIKGKILSPTFVIIKRFQFNNLTIKQFNNFYHIDCYRIKCPEEILALGFRKLISDPKNIICIEWADKIKKILPKDVILLKLSFEGKNKRRITRKTLS
jgi:tRNA threonylcarbamoyladenosine biosynthesis protein TsaE